MSWNKNGSEAETEKLGQQEGHDGGSQERDLADPADGRVSRRREKGRGGQWERARPEAALPWPGPPSTSLALLFVSVPLFSAFLIEDTEEKQYHLYSNLGFEGLEAGATTGLSEGDRMSTLDL